MQELQWLPQGSSPWSSSEVGDWRAAMANVVFAVSIGEAAKRVCSKLPVGARVGIDR